MKRLILISTALGCVMLSGCAIHDRHRHPVPRGARVVVPAPVVVVPVPVVVDTKPAKHCPPGQAKKGKC
jgi:hypothetical protein